MSGIKNVPTLGFCKANSDIYVLRDGRECASPRELIMDIQHTAERVGEEQRKAAMFSSNTPSMIMLRELRETLFEIALDKAFLLGCRGLSIGDRDIIADDSRVITSATRNSTFFRYSAWELVDFLGVGAGRGDGRGNGVYQYQYHSFYFADSHQGVWSTTTGERLCDPFKLFGCITELHDFYATLYKPSEISKTALERRTKPEATTCEAVPC